MRKKNKGQSDSDADSSYSSSVSSDSSGQRRKRGKKPKTKRQRLQNKSSDDEPQPSTSRAGNDVEDVNENDSGSESADSDYGPVKDKSLVKKKTVQKKRIAANVADTSKQKKQRNSDGNSTRASQKTGLNVSNNKLGKSLNCNGTVLDSNIVESLAQKCVYFLLVEDQKKYAIRRKAIITHVFKDDQYSPKLYLAVINKANNILQKIFGMELMQLENQKDSYLIINILKRELGINEYYEMSRLKEQQYGLITYLLTVIFMNDNAITESELTKALKPLGVDLTSKRLHPVFGDVKKFITTELVKQMYLTYECVSKEPPNYEFRWGLRAKQEFDKSDLLEFACKVMGDTSPEDWKIQYRDAESSSKAPGD